MIGNRLEQEIVSLYNEDITALYSINQIAQNLNKAYPYINKKVNSLIKNNILKKTEVGRSHLCTVNLQSDKAIWLLVLNEIKKKDQLLKKDKKARETSNAIQELAEATSLKMALHTHDRLILVADEKDKQTFRKSKTLNKYNLQICTEKEFQNIVLEDEDILKSHTIIYGYEKFYQMLKEVRKPLRIKYSRLLQ